MDVSVVERSRLWGNSESRVGHGDWELSEASGGKTAGQPPAACKRLHQDLLNLGDLFCAELTVGQHAHRIFNLAGFTGTDQY